MLFVEVPAARARDKYGSLVIELVFLSALFERDRAPHRGGIAD